MKVRIIYILFIILPLISLYPSITKATEFSVGVSPSVVEIEDEMEKGSSKIVKFNLITVSDEPLLVQMTPEKGNLDFFLKNQYKNLIFNFSEEDTTGWIHIFDNPVELIPTEESKKGHIKAWKEISVLISVPENADSGYHVMSIKPTPYVPETSGGPVGALIIAVVSVNFIFNVKGEANREGVIIDVVNGGYTSGGIKLHTYFKNTGTTTISGRTHHKIYNKDGSFIMDGYSSVEYIRPKETIIFEAPIRIGTPIGEYIVSTSVEYRTGKAETNTTIDFGRPVTPAIVAPPPQAFQIPWTIIILILVTIISIGIYRWNK